jgi:hypothetical protein
MKRILLITKILLVTAFILPFSAEAQQTRTTTNINKEKQAAEELAKVELEKAKKKMTEEQLKLLEEQLKADVVLRFGPEGEGRRSGSVVTIGEQYPGWYQQGNYGMSMRGMPRTSWDFSRTVTENSSSKEYTFEVEKDMKSLSLSISGMSKTGEIRIIVIMPGNKTYSEVVIDEYGSLNWKKSFELNEEAKDKYGVWKFKVSTTKASGNFRITLTGN